MANYKTVVNEWQRMCRSGAARCSKCPLFQQMENSTCRNWMLDHPEKAEEIIMTWSEEHPIVTNEKRFEEIFGVKPSAVFSLMRSSMDWLNAEYKGGDNHD